MPSLAEHYGYGIPARLEIGGDIIGDIKDAFIIRCPSRVQHVPPDLVPIQAQLRVAKAADISPCPGDLLPQFKLLAELVFPSDPLGFPVIARKEARLETGDLTEGTLAAVFIPISDSPITGVGAFKRFSRVDDMGRIG